MAGAPLGIAKSSVLKLIDASAVPESAPKVSLDGLEWILRPRVIPGGKVRYWKGAEGYVLRAEAGPDREAFVKLLSGNKEIQDESAKRWERVKWLADRREEWKTRPGCCGDVPHSLRALPIEAFETDFGILDAPCWGYLQHCCAGVVWKDLKSRSGPQSLSPATRASLAYQLALAVQWLEQHDIAHCDLSHTNLVVRLDSLNAEPNLSLVDFDLFFSPHTVSLAVHRAAPGLPGYLAPPGANQVQVGYDRFALGLLIYEFLTWDQWGADPPHVLDQSDINQGRLQQVLAPHAVRPFGLEATLLLTSA